MTLGKLKCSLAVNEMKKKTMEDQGSDPSKKLG